MNAPAEPEPQTGEVSMAPKDDMKRYANDLWQQAIDQIDDARDSLLKSRDRFEADMHRVRQERDRLLIKLGEQTLKLTRQDQLKLPKAIQKPSTDSISSSTT